MAVSAQWWPTWHYMYECDVWYGVWRRNEALSVDCKIQRTAYRIYWRPSGIWCMLALSGVKEAQATTTFEVDRM